MTKRRLRWVPGDACRGKHYYLHAWLGEVKYTLTKIFVNGVERYEVWRGKEFLGIFDDRIAALNHAEGVL